MEFVNQQLETIMGILGFLGFLGSFFVIRYVLWCLSLWFGKKHQLDYYLANNRYVTLYTILFIISIPLVFVFAIETIEEIEAIVGYLDKNIPIKNIPIKDFVYLLVAVFVAVFLVFVEVIKIVLRYSVRFPRLSSFNDFLKNVIAKFEILSIIRKLRMQNKRIVTWVLLPSLFFAMVYYSCYPRQSFHPELLVYESNLYGRDSLKNKQLDTLAILVGEEGKNSLIIGESQSDLSEEIRAQQKDPSLLWTIFYHFIDPGNQHMTTTPSGRKWAGLIGIIGVILVNGLLVSLFVNIFEKRGDNYSKGRARYDNLFRKKGGHYVVVGGSNLVINIVKDLFDKHKADGPDMPYILIQSSSDIEQLRHKLFSILNENYHEKLIIYAGTRTSDDDIRELKCENAKGVYVIGEPLDVDGMNHDSFNMECLTNIVESIKLSHKIESDIKVEKKNKDIQDNQKGGENKREQSTEAAEAKETKEIKEIKEIKETKAATGKKGNNGNQGNKRVYVLFENQMTYSVFQFSEICKDTKEYINFIPLNYYEMWAQKVFAAPDPTNLIGNGKSGEDAIDYFPLDMLPNQEDKPKNNREPNRKNDLNGTDVPPEDIKFISDHEDDKHYVHLVVIGMTKMGVAMALEAAHLCHYPNCLTAKAPRTRITFIDENADRESGYVMNRYDVLFDLARWRYVDATKSKTRKGDQTIYIESNYNCRNCNLEEFRINKKLPECASNRECKTCLKCDSCEYWYEPLYCPTSKSKFKYDAPNGVSYLSRQKGFDENIPGDEFFIDIEWEFIKGSLSNHSVLEYLRECATKDENKILTVAVCLDEPHQAISAGLYLPDEVYEKALQVLVYQRYSDSLLKDLSNKNTEGFRYKKVKPFGMLSQTFSLMSVDHQMAKYINYIYNSDDISLEESEGKLEDEWEETISKFKEGKSGTASRWSNIYHANTLVTKLRSIGYNESANYDNWGEMVELYKNNGGGVRWNSTDEAQKAVINKNNDENGIKTLVEKVTKLSIAEHNRWNLEQLLLHTLPLDFNRYSYFEDITRRKKELLAELFAQNEDEKSGDKERLLVNFDLKDERGERLFNRYIPVGELQKDFYHLFYDKLEGVRNLKSEKERIEMYDEIIEEEELLKEEDIQKRKEKLLNSEKKIIEKLLKLLKKEDIQKRMEGLLNSEKKIIEELLKLLKEEDIQKPMERLLNSEKDERLDSSEARIALARIALARIAFYDHALKRYKNELKSRMRHLNICSNNRLEEVEYGVNENDLKIVLGMPFIVKKYRESNMGL